MEQPKPNPEIRPPHVPEITPGAPDKQQPPSPHKPEIAPNKQDPNPSKGPAEIPPKNP